MQTPDRRPSQVAGDCSEPISVTDNDLQYGVVTKTFYGTELQGGIWGEKNNTVYWDNISFQITEV